ncbi:MAG: hypothetical protein QM308_04985 [Bacillota bacterium]|nr:hypothetical protein [Bacillota bacterium]
MKLGIIGGAGLVGSTTAFLAGIQNLVSEIKLVDLNRKMQMSHTMDMGQAMLEYSDTNISAGDYADLEECDIILLSASLPERNVQNRNEYLKGNLSIVESICTELQKLSNEKILIMATNPIDVFNYIAWKILKWDRSKFIGFCYNDTIRMKWALSKELGINYQDIEAICIGEHGEGQVPLYQNARHLGKPLDLGGDKIESAKSQISNWFKDYQSLESGRTSGWTSAVGLTEVIKRITGKEKTPISCSAVLNGEYGLHDLSIGTPVELGEQGIVRVIEENLGKEDENRYRSSAEKIKQLINSVGY